MKEKLYELATKLNYNCSVMNSVTMSNGECAESTLVNLSKDKDEYKFDSIDDAVNFLSQAHKTDAYICNVFSQIKNVNYPNQYIPILHEDKSCELLILTKDNRFIKEMHFDCIYCLWDYFSNMDPREIYKDDCILPACEEKEQACVYEELADTANYDADFVSYKEIDGIVTLFNSRYMDHPFGWRMKRVKNTLFMKSKIYGLHLQLNASTYSSLVHTARMIYTDQLFKEYMKMCQSLVQEQLDAMLVINDEDYCLEIISLDDNNTELKLENMTMKEFANTIYSIIKQS